MKICLLLLLTTSILVDCQYIIIEDGPKRYFRSVNNQCDPKPIEKKCYVQSGRIVGGHEASENAYPFMAVLMRVDSFLDPVPFCGGSLIDESHVLTAAHCFNE